MQFQDFDVQRAHMQDLQRQAHHLNRKGGLLMATKPAHTLRLPNLVLRLQDLIRNAPWTRTSTPSCEPLKNCT